MKTHEHRSDEIFVFGSNEAGRHGKGAVLHAMKLGAVPGVSFGRRGKTFAIPTKDKHLKTLKLEQIQTYAFWFLSYARQNPNLKFFLTRVGCGLAGYTDKEIAPFFEGAPPNVRKPPGW